MIHGEKLAIRPTANNGCAFGPTDAASEAALEEVRASLRGLQYGSVNIIVQDGLVIQIDRTEKRRLHSRRDRAS